MKTTTMTTKMHVILYRRHTFLKTDLSYSHSLLCWPHTLRQNAFPVKVLQELFWCHIVHPCMTVRVS